MPVFFIHSNQVSNRILHLTGPLVKHISGSLRKRKGDQIVVMDERRTRYDVELLVVRPKAIIGKILQESSQEPVPPVRLILAQSILKSKKMDWVLQKATELGVSRIVPVRTERTVVDPRPDRIEAQLGRWQEILKEAAQQTGRWDIPGLEPPTDLPSFLKNESSFDLGLMLWEGERRNDLKTALKACLAPERKIHDILILIGPEGGLAPSEVSLAQEHRIVPVNLGWRILRSETAALTVLSIIQYELGDLAP